MVLRKRVAIFDREWGLNSVPREGQKIPCCVQLTSCVNTAKFPDSSMSSISSFVVDLPAENTKQQQDYYQIYR